MSRQGENIYHRKDGRWEGRYIKGRKLDGSIQYGYVYRNTREETKRVLNVFKSSYQPTVMKPRPEISLTFKEWVTVWLRRIELQVKKTTLSNYHYKLNKYILPIFKHKKLYEINEESIYSYIEELQSNHLSMSSIQSIFTLFKQILSSGLSSIQCDATFLSLIKLPKRDWTKVTSLSLSEQKKLTLAADQEPEKKGLPVLIALHTGMRIGEIAALEWHDIDFDKNIIQVSKTCQRILDQGKTTAKTYIHIDETKTKNSIRVIPMTPYLREKLIHYKHNNAMNRWVFTNNDGPCEPRLLTNYFHTIRKKVDLTHIHFHQLRHTFATRCLEALSDIPTVSALLGHKSTQLTLDVYSDVLMDQRLQTIEKIAAYIS
ncbi:tyrosine-type recombinase/integrase [Enterococcus sp. LJL120]|uniref:tyrosine-type recombinase/integrase n=1 Tax=Enterococcus sp. HY326 TaxID=2971265 RepID=UPI002240BA3F|nr:site-specific integrase [Enterococcus sp. HY326]